MRVKRSNYVTTLARLFEYSTRAYSKRKFLNLLDTDCNYTYGSFRRECLEVSRKMSQFGVGAGDRVAVLAPSCPNWVVAMFSTVSFGRVFVPILPDSTETEVTNIIRHSDSKVLFVSKKLLSRVSQECLDRLTLVIAIEDLSFIRKNDEAFTCDAVCKDPVPDDIAALLYTSGTTGNAKGVMLSHRNFIGNIAVSVAHEKARRKDVWFSVLPLAHTYELSIGLLYPMYAGASVYYMSRPPATTVLLSSLAKVKPTIMLTVPLIIEKIYKQSVVPTIQKSRTLSWMDKHMHRTMCRLICRKLKKTFGGRIRFFGIGGAKLDPQVETFLKTGGFPYSIGYGCTECAPMVCSSKVGQTVPGSIGKAVATMEVRLNDVNPETGEGEIVTRGENVMLGYYKDPDRTKAAFTEDGWYRTNDLATMDSKGRFYIKGRLNNLILGPSGENIYPEEIEHVIDDMDGVNESLVVEREGKLVALVNFGESAIDWNHEGEDEFFDRIEAQRKAVMAFVNKRVKGSSKISDVEVMKEPFEKTATHKVRRFLYKNAKGVGRWKSENKDQ